MVAPRGARSERTGTRYELADRAAAGVHGLADGRPGTGIGFVGHPVSIHVGIAGVAHAVPIRIRLVRIGDERAVVQQIADAVAVAVDSSAGAWLAEGDIVPGDVVCRRRREQGRRDTGIRRVQRQLLDERRRIGADGAARFDGAGVHVQLIDSAVAGPT